jgi:hypothetical protein
MGAHSHGIQQNEGAFRPRLSSRSASECCMSWVVEDVLLLHSTALIFYQHCWTGPTHKVEMLGDGILLGYNLTGLSGGADLPGEWAYTFPLKFLPMTATCLAGLYNQRYCCSGMLTSI